MRLGPGPTLTLILALLGSSLAVASAEAQWRPDGNPNGGTSAIVSLGGDGILEYSGYNLVRIHAGTAGTIINPLPNLILLGDVTMIPDGLGGGIVAAPVSGSANLDIAVNRVNASPARLWSNGVVLSTESHDQNYPSLVSDGAGGAIVGWLDNRSGTDLDIYTRKVTGGGLPQWTSSGVAVCAIGGDQSGMVLASDGSGGAIFAWQDSRPGSNGRDIYARRVNASGVVQWAVNGIPVSAAADSQSFPAICSDGLGGAIIAWWDERSGGRDIYAQRIDASGVALWTPDGILVASGPGDQLLPILLPDGANGAFVVWEDHRAGGDDGLDIYAQRVSGAGAVLWDVAGVSVCSAQNRQEGHSVVSDAAGGIIVGWVDRRRGAGDRDLCAQRLDASGNVLWTLHGVRLATPVGGERTLSVPDGAGGAVIHGGGSLARVFGNGMPAWIPNYQAFLAISDEPDDQGGWVRLVFPKPLGDDGALGPMVTQYSVWRKLSGSAALGTSRAEAGTRARVAASFFDRGSIVESVASSVPGYDFPPGTWQSLGLHPATHLSQYILLAPTRDDSTLAGAADDHFLVLSHSDALWNYVVGPEIAGHSLDNLPPLMPQNLRGGRSGPTTVELQWSANGEGDFSAYSVHRGASLDFIPSTQSRIGQPTAAAWTDSQYESGTTHYKISSTDRHGNQSAFAVLVPGDVAAFLAETVPLQSYLRSPSPNPMRVRSTVEFGLARAGMVQLALHDVTGRRIRTLVAGSWPAGIHRIGLNVVDDDGGALPTGLYFLKITGPSNVVARRLMVVE